MNRLTRLAVIGGTTLGLSLVAGPALAAPMPEPTCTTESGGVPGENAYTVTTCESSTSKTNKNKTTTVTEFSQEFRDEEYGAYDTATTRETTTSDGDTRARTTSTHETFNPRTGSPSGEATECTSTYNSKTGKYSQKCR